MPFFHCTKQVKTECSNLNAIWSCVEVLHVITVFITIIALLKDFLNKALFFSIDLQAISYDINQFMKYFLS